MRDTGCGLYTAGLIIEPRGGAFVAIEKRPRKTGRYHERYDQDGFRQREDVWEDVLVIVGAERLTGTVPDMVATVAGRLESEPMKDDTVSHVDVTTLGDPLRRMFYERGAYPHAVRIGGEIEQRDQSTGIVTLPVRVLHGLATVALQTERLNVLDTLSEGPGLLRSLENLDALPDSGPGRDLAYAAALAVWTAHVYQTGGPWASRKPPPVDANDEWAREARRQAFLRARREEKRRGPWWAALAERDRR